MSPELDGSFSGRRIGNYRLERELGRGGMGVVYLATHVALERSVALKLLLPELAQDAGVVARMLQEARCAAQITGHHVVRVIDVDQLETGQPFIVMEYVEGEDLARLLAREGPPPAARAVLWVIEACVAIAEAHDKGIVHRDLKPENLLLAEEEGGARRIKVLDFGISKMLHRTGLRAVTRPHDLLGSPQYMAPEQIRTPLLVDARADLWALGTILIELLTGTAAFPGQTAMEVWAGVLEAEPHLPEEQVVLWPPGLVEVARKALQKSPEDRYQTVLQLVTALAPFAPAEAQPALAAIQRRAARASGAERTEAAPAASAAGAAATVRTAPRRARNARRALLVLLVGAALLATVVALRSAPLAKPSAAAAVTPVLAEPARAELRVAPPPPAPAVTPPAPPELREPLPPAAPGTPPAPPRPPPPRPAPSLRPLPTVAAPRVEPPRSDTARSEPPRTEPAPAAAPAVSEAPRGAWDLTTFGGRL